MPESQARDRLVHQSLRVSKILCSATMLTSLVTAVGWIGGVPVLTQAHPSLPVMHPNTALGLLMSALAILWTGERATGQWRASLAALLASAVLLLGLLTLGEYTFGWNIGIDTILLPNGAALDAPFPGRPSPQSSFNFALLGAAIVWCNLGWRPFLPAQVAAIAAGANAILAVTGYAFGAGIFFGFPLDMRTAGMAVHTAIAFILLVVAFFCARPHDGMMTLIIGDTRAGAMTTRILLAGIVAPSLVGALARIGVVFGWYEGSVEVSLFALAMIALILLTTWQAARQSEREELSARAAAETVGRANQELRRAVEERQIFAAFIENSPDFIGIADAHGKPTYLNPGGRRMVGLAPDHPVDRTAMLDYYAPEQRSLASKVIIKSMVDRGQWQGETYFRNWETQQAIPVSDTHFLIRDPASHQILGMGTITRDISEIKRAREELDASRRRLEHANDELRRMNEKAKELDRFKTQLFANISHELRTPLMLILGPIETHLGSRRELDTDLRQDLEIVRRNARTLLRHVNDLLDVARLQAGRLKPDYVEEDAAALVRFVAALFSALSREKRIDFSVQTPATLPVQVDVDKLQRILLNLVSNAFKFTPPGGRVRISLRDADGRMVVEVGDSGPGIPEEKRQEVFEPFRQLERGSTRPGGTGLGLSIVKDFTSLLGGTISIADASEGGALFVLDFPKMAPQGISVRSGAGERTDVRDAEQMVATLRDRRPPETTAAGAAATGEEGLVLVVEDHHDMSRFVKETLEARGFRVAVAFDGRDGYEMAVGLRPDLVLTDVMLPAMSGDELLRALRQRADLDSMPIVVLTARADQAFHVRLLREGAQDYLEKPFAVEELVARVKNLVDRKRADDRSSRLRQQVEAVARASMSVSEAIAGLPETSVRAVLGILALNAQNMTSAEFVAAGLGDDPSRPFDPWVTAGTAPELAERIGHGPRPIGVLGLVAREDKTIRTRDLRELPEYRGLPLQHPVMTSFLGVPIRYRGQSVGSLYLTNKRTHPEFTDQDQRVVEMLADRAGGAIETAKLFAAEGVKRAWLQAVIDQMPEAIVLMDAEGRITLQNRSMCSLGAGPSQQRDRFGNPLTIDLRRPSGEPLLPDELPIVRAIVDRATTQGHEFVARRTDGGLVPLLVNAAPILGKHGELAGATMVCQDVSTLKELEHLREEWASVVAHDLQQPIAVIALRSDLLLRQDLTPQQAAEVHQVRAAAKRLSRMVNDLMDASQLETKRLRVAPKRLDVGQLVRDVVGRIPEAATRTEIGTPANWRLFVKGDAQRLEQVMTNLLSNALKYSTPDTSIRIDVRENKIDAAVQVSIANRGPGIPSHELPKIFERFVRLSAARRSGTRGSGLGLYIAKGLIEAHGGRIWAESVPGETTTFHFTIPLDGPPVPIGAPASPDAALHAGN
jgi:PAS domain S-box-containing protein